jgi:ERCC4-related helicase
LPQYFYKFILFNSDCFFYYKSSNIKPICLLGANNNSTEGIQMSINQQKETIKKFQDGKFNLLVATDIAQEGLDIPECNYVIRYEFVSNEIGTVQSRGRARAEKGQTFLITVKGNFKISIFFFRLVHSY